MVNVKKWFINKREDIKLLLAILFLIGIIVFANISYKRLRTVTYIIPPGAGEKLADGQDTVELPDELILTGIQDTLVIENQDDVVHSFGPFVILPHTTLLKRFTTSGTYQGSCTFHPDQHVTLTVKR